MFTKTVSVAALLSLAVAVSAEKHTVKLVNNCAAKGDVILKDAMTAQTLSTNDDYSVDGPLSAVYAYFDNGCGNNGEKCAIVEAALSNDQFSIADISLIPDHAYNAGIAFEFTNGCDGQGVKCVTHDCKEAYLTPEDQGKDVACDADDVDITITFC